MTVAGNPPDYIIMFGGVAQEIIENSVSTVAEIRETLNDLWVYHVGSRLWQRLYVNSPTKPDFREMAVMATVKEDRMLLMYGGLNG